jgi:hypothetical protein
MPTGVPETPPNGRELPMRISRPVTVIRLLYLVQPVPGIVGSNLKASTDKRRRGPNPSESNPNLVTIEHR